MLDRPLIVQVAGDGEAGFFRPRTEYGATTRPRRGPARGVPLGQPDRRARPPARSGCCCCRSRLANVAMWLRPPATGHGPADGARPVPALRAHHVGHLHPRRGRRLPGPGRVAVRRPGQPAASASGRGWGSCSPASSSPPAAGWRWPRSADPASSSLLWFLAVRSWARYESYQLPERNADGDGLATPTFWDGRDQVGRLRSLHIAAMFAIIDAMLLYVLLDHDLERRRVRRGRPGADLTRQRWSPLRRVLAGRGRGDRGPVRAAAAPAADGRAGVEVAGGQRVSPGACAGSRCWSPC